MSTPSHPRAETGTETGIDTGTEAGGRPGSEPDRDALHVAVRARRARAARRQREGQGSLARDLALVGVLGWTIVGPTLLGLFGGRWLDRRLGTGIFWTGALLALGLAAGCVLAWRRVRGS